jgi:hypothetical protein
MPRDCSPLFGQNTGICVSPERRIEFADSGGDKEQGSQNSVPLVRQARPVFSLAMPPVSFGLLIALSLWTSALAQGPATPVISELLASNSEELKEEGENRQLNATDWPIDVFDSRSQSHLTQTSWFPHP